MNKITQAKYYKTASSTVTVDETDEKSRIISDITISGGERPTSEYKAIDGTNYPFVGGPNMVQVQFDFLQASSFNIVEMVYGAGTTSGSTQTITWDGTGSAKTITIANVRSAADGNTYTLTLTDVEGISAPIKYENEKGVVRTFTGLVSPSNIAEANLVNVA